IAKDSLSQAAWRDAQRDVLVPNELHQLEDCHHFHADGQLIQVRDQLTRAPASEVVDPIIAVGCDAELAQPTKNNAWLRLNRDAAIEAVIGTREVPAAAKVQSSFVGYGSPGVTERGHRNSPETRDENDHNPTVSNGSEVPYLSRLPATFR